MKLARRPSSRSLKPAKASRISLRAGAVSSTWYPSPAARAAPARSRVVFPAPAGPASTSAPEECCSPARKPLISASSASRPKMSADMARAYAARRMYPPVPGHARGPHLTGQLEGLLRQLHEVERDRLGDLALGGQARQHRGREESGGRYLALVERLVVGGQTTLAEPGQRHLSLPGEQPADDQVAECEQQPGGVQPDPVDLSRLGHARAEVAVHGRDDGLEVSGGTGQGRALLLQTAVARFRRRELADLPEQVGERRALVPHDLAEVQVHALNGGRALIEAVDLGVPDVLLDRVVLQVAGAAEGLQ